MLSVSDRNSPLVVFCCQGLEGYFLDPVFDQNPRKRKHHLPHLHRFIPQFAQICTRENLVQMNCFVHCIAEFIKLVHRYKTCSIGTKVLKTINNDKNETKC